MRNILHSQIGIFFVAVTAILIAGCNDSSSKNGHEQDSLKKDPIVETIETNKRNPAEPLSLFTKADAEKILGEPAHLTDTSREEGKGYTMWKWAYTADEKDKKKGKTGVIYFLYEQYTYDSSAHRVYDFFKKANEDHGIKVLENFGDEAYYHSDNTNFYFIMARKGNKMFRIKVNKITSNTSLDVFNRISKDITATL